MTKITNFVWNSVDDCIISELDGAGAVQAAYTNEPQQYGGVIGQRRGTTTSTYHTDAVGSTRFLSDSSGNVTDTYLHDAWGNLVASTGTTVNSFKWVGKYGYYTDNSTAQVYVRARMYQPMVARWASVDPYLFVDGLNLYLTSNNSPAISFDPAGLFSLLVPTDPYGECQTCCCSPLTMEFSDIQVFDAFKIYQELGLDVMYGQYVAFGFKVVVQMENTFVFFGESEPCKIAWYECGPDDGSLGRPAGEWIKISDSGKPPSGVKSDWEDPTPCPGKFSRYWGDSPTIANDTGKRKQLNFAVFVKGGEHCGAAEKKLLFHLDVTVKKHSSILDRVVFDPMPPVLKQGLANIDGCEEERIKHAIELK